MSLNIYLFFDGRCGEAFDFYRSIFGGEFMMSSTFAEAPPDMPVADGDKDKIMHVSYQIGDSVLMGSDNIEGFGEVSPAGGNFAISYSAASKEEADEKFASLSDGGTVSVPINDTFWGAYFGQCTDRFGIMWMVSYSPQEG